MTMPNKVQAQWIDFLVGQDTVLSLKDYRANSTGDVFTFIDIADAHTIASDLYMEVAARGKIKDRWYFAGMLESGTQHREVLIGISTDVLDLPNHTLQMDLYRRSDNHYQFTIVWNTLVKGFTLEGFLDYGRFGSVAQPQIWYSFSSRIAGGVEGQYFTIGKPNHGIKGLLRITL